MRIAIIVNGEINDYDATKQILTSVDYIIACDGGLRHAKIMALWPDAIIGDLDSAPSTYLSVCKQRGIPIYRYPADKDDTDLALAMAHALAQPVSSIIIIGALGGRVDHFIANVHVLEMAKGIHTEIWDNNTSIQLIHSSLCMQKDDYQTLSLIPLSTEVTGITTHGLSYPLNNETLRLGVVRGVSNCFNASEAVVTIESGVLIAIRSKF